MRFWYGRVSGVVWVSKCRESSVEGHGGRGERVVGMGGGLK